MGRAGLLCTLAVFCSCAYQVLPMGESPPALSPPDPPLRLTVAVREGSFDQSNLNGDAIVAHFADELRQSRVFEGVMHPMPADIDPMWQLELSASDGGVEPDSNFWKGFFTQAVPPVAIFVYFQNDYTLELQALLLKNRKLVETYRARSTIRHRYQIYANKKRMQTEALDTLARTATRQVLAELKRDADRLRRENSF
ncbi:MAG: hypothetical protein GY725_14305 [bacterium]|nr:hypothetical protein [bacterium]